MLACDDCKVFFFSIEGLLEHNKWCIGYKPIERVNGKRKSTILM